MSDFRISAQERQTPVWRRLKAHFAETLQRERERNDRMTDEATTAERRGKIAMLKRLMDLDKELPADIPSTGE